MVSPQKRKRTLSDDPNPSTSNELATCRVPTKSKYFYFEDGNIVLIAENVAFRVYKGLLARHSTIFRDMFSIVNQPTNGETFDGCPAVRLSDTSRDITMLLCALNDNTQFTCDADGVRVLTSVLRMASKYLMDPLRNICIKALCESYPDTLAEWDRCKGTHFSPNAVVLMIDADILLPSAYYALCSRPWNELSCAEDKIPSHVLEAYCKGKENMASRFAVFFEQDIPMERLFQDEDCKFAWDSLEETAMSKLGKSDRIIRPDPLHMLQELLEYPCTEDMCGRCHKNLKEIIQAERSSVWDSLPEFFELGTWKELREKYKDSLTSQSVLPLITQI